MARVCIWSLKNDPAGARVLGGLQGVDAHPPGQAGRAASLHGAGLWRDQVLEGGQCPSDAQVGLTPDVAHLS